MVSIGSTLIPMRWNARLLLTIDTDPFNSWRRESPLGLQRAVTAQKAHFQRIANIAPNIGAILVLGALRTVKSSGWGMDTTLSPMCAAFG